MIDIGKRRECFFDDYLIDTDKTTAKKRLHKPVRRNVIMELNQPWEGSHCYFFSVLHAEEKWRMYYVCQHGSDRYVAYAESDDAEHWVRPDLGIVEYQGSTHNNLIFNPQMLAEQFDFIGGFDNMGVTYDENPACPADERYKMACMWIGHASLLLMMSADGIHFTKSRLITSEGAFDSENRVFWSAEHNKYFCYYRWEHDPLDGNDIMDRSYTDAIARKLYDPMRFLLREPGDGTASFLRDVRVIESKDGVNWSEQKLIETTGKDYQLYTNGVFPYPRAPHLLVAFPMRYVERKAWTKNFEELCGREDRLKRMEKMARFGLATSDGLFMCSRDGYHFTKYDEAMFPPPAENPEAFVYGDGRVSAALVEVPSEINGADNEYMMIVNEGFRSVRGPLKLVKYTTRLDGFVSLHAGGETVQAVTKEFTYDGTELHVNIATSGRGSCYFTLQCGEESVTSVEVFGNATDKRVRFEDDEAVARLSGKPVTLTLTMFDCDVYSIRFE